MTKVEFRNYKGDYCAFTDDSVIFSNSELKEAKVFPLGSIKKITSFSGVKLVAHNGDCFFFSFLYMRKKIVRKIKDLVARIATENKISETAQPYTIEINETKKESIEQIRKPHFSRKRIIKLWVTLGTLLVTTLVLITLIIGLINEQSNSDKLNSKYNEVSPDWQEQWQ